MRLEAGKTYCGKTMDNIICFKVDEQIGESSYNITLLYSNYNKKNITGYKIVDNDICCKDWKRPIAINGIYKEKLKNNVERHYKNKIENIESKINKVQYKIKFYTEVEKDEFSTHKLKFYKNLIKELEEEKVMLSKELKEIMEVVN